MNKELLGLIAEQEQAIGIIQKMQINFKKTGKGRLTRGYVKARKEILEQYWKNFVETNRVIIKTINKEDMENLAYFTNDYYSAYEEFYINLKAEMTDMLDDTAQISSGRSQSEEIKLPEINIPQFTGNYQDWTSFHDLFVSLIHKKSSLGNVQKLHYLKSCLSGEPEHLLKHFPITDNNYDLAWNMLQGRYNNKRIIINSILNRIINQKKISTATAKSIRELLDTTIECLNKLKAQGVNTNSWDTIIIFITVSKLDTETHKEWEKEVSDMKNNELPSWFKFEKFLEKRFRVLEMMQPTQSTNANPTRNVQRVPYDAIDLKSFLVAIEIKCTFCKLNHHIFQCREFQQLKLEKKIDVVQNERLCFNCLMPGHPARYCKNKSSCHTCGKRHHTLLHRSNTSSHSHERQIRETKHERRNKEIKQERQNRETNQQRQNRDTNQEIQDEEKQQREAKQELTEKRANNQTEEQTGEDRYGKRVTTDSDEQHKEKIATKDNRDAEIQKQFTQNLNSRGTGLRKGEHMIILRNKRDDLSKDLRMDTWRKKSGKTERNKIYF